MKLLLDGRELDDRCDPGCTLQTLLADLRARHLAGRLVTAVSVNGRLCLGDELSARLAQPVAAGDEIEIESGCALEIASSALRSVGDELARLGEAQAEVAGAINAGRIPEAIELIRDFVTGWQGCQSAIVQCGRLLDRDLTAHEFDGQHVDGHLRELVGKLREVRDALEVRDFVLLADLFHYEMPELCARWNDLLRELADSVVAVEKA